MGLIKNLFLNINAFQSTQFFRFDREAKYTNFLGGVCTVFILGLLVIMLSFKMMDVLNYTNVTVSATTSYQLQEVNTTLSPSSE
jgi:hypothetical protein